MSGTRPHTPTERLELWSAILISIATVATAYSAYESTRWSGRQSTEFTSAGAARTESAKARADHAANLAIDAGLFADFAGAYTDDKKRLQSAIQGIFRREFRPAVKEWLALDPLNNKGAPATPFALKSYRPRRLIESRRLEREAVAHFESGREANQNSDNYVLATIIFAAVLFFAGIATKFTSRELVTAMLGAGTLVFAAGLVRLVTLPFL